MGARTRATSRRGGGSASTSASTSDDGEEAMVDHPRASASDDAGCKTPERVAPSAEDVTALLGSPGFFNFCASSLSPIAMPTRGRGVRAGAGEDGDGDDDGRGRGAGFNSPSMRCARGERRADAGEGGRWVRWARGRWAGAAREGGGDDGVDGARGDGGRSWRRRETRERGGSDGHERERLTMSDDGGARSERGVEKRSERGMSAVERLALSAEASLRRGGAADDGSGERASYGRKQLNVDFAELDAQALQDDQYVLQNMYDEFDDSVLGVETHPSRRQGSVPPKSREQEESATKRSSTTGASVEWTKGFTKTLKNFDADSPRVGTRSARRVSYPSSDAETPVAKSAATRTTLGKSSASSANTKFAGACKSPMESKKCNCKKSKCLKLYCECFAAGIFCKDCSCQQCQNTVENSSVVEKTREQIELRNPNAFASKILDEDGDEGRHTKGCHCKKSACLKKYCECFQAGVKCQDYCKCEGCKNKDDGAAPTGPRGGATKAVKTQKAKSRVKDIAEVSNIVPDKALEEDLVIEDFKFDKFDKVLGSPLRSFEHADDISTEYSNLSKSVAEQSPLRTLLLSEGVELSPFFSTSTIPQSALSPVRAGQMSPLRPNGFMSPLTPGMRPGPGRYSIRGSTAKAPVPLFSEDSGNSGDFKTPRDRKMNSVFGGMHDPSKDGALRATFTSPVPLSTPDVHE